MRMPVRFSPSPVAFAGAAGYTRAMLMVRIRSGSALALLLLAITWSAPVVAADAGTVLQTWQMLDYMAADYPGAVRDGKVIDAAEYQEMRQFAATAASRVAGLDPTPATPDLKAKAAGLVAAIDAKESADAVANRIHALNQSLLQAYPVPTAPTQAPDVAHGAALYQTHCATCHGIQGRGDGPAGANLVPAPVDFTDIARADQRSALSLYEVISQGVDGTSMASYADSLSSPERWDLAYFVGTLAYADAADAGAAAWHDDPTARARISGLADLTHARVAQVAPGLGTDKARALVGYLRAHPDAVGTGLSGLPLARGRLAASVAAYRSGATAEATRLALSAYLDGVEPVEPLLDIRDRPLRSQIERAMGAYRSALGGQAPVAEIEAKARQVDTLLARAGDVTGSRASDGSAVFVGAFTILVREGLEALLIVVALLAFLHKAERTDGVRYVHLGWILALLAGAITWAVARYAISISGASRELTEGLSSLFAAIVLISVGLWMHQKSIGGRWQAYLKQKMTAAMDQRSLWLLFGLAFISVYREIFETILFYTALWDEGQQHWLVAGIAAGALVLGVIAWVMLRTSRRLPIGLFFKASSALIAVLAVVLTGKGIAALQEAGWIAVTHAPFPTIDLLGIYPTWQSLLAQVAIIALLAIGFGVNVVRGRRVQLVGAS